MCVSPERAEAGLEGVQTLNPQSLPEASRGGIAADGAEVQDSDRSKRGQARHCPEHPRKILPVDEQPTEDGADDLVRVFHRPNQAHAGSGVLSVNTRSEQCERQGKDQGLGGHRSVSSRRAGLAPPRCWAAETR